MLKTIGQSIKKQVIATIGYGPQGRGQSLNLRDRIGFLVSQFGSLSLDQEGFPQLHDEMVFHE